MKTILITGATSGFGKAVAEIFSKEAKLILAGRRLDRLESLQKSLNCPTHILNFDVQNMEACEEAINSLPKEFQNIDILVNNAGLALGLEPADKTNWLEWEQMIHTNVLGLAKMTHLVLPFMVANGGGQIINIGSVAGNYAYPGANVYGATKAFVGQFTKNLRSDLVNKNIRVCNIEPGLAKTEFSEVRFNGDKEKAKSVYSGTEPLIAKDIAESVYWVANRPKHVNINSLEIMPTCQAWGPFQILRD